MKIERRSQKVSKLAEARTKGRRGSEADWRVSSVQLMIDYRVEDNRFLCVEDFQFCFNDLLRSRPLALAFHFTSGQWTPANTEGA